MPDTSASTRPEERQTHRMINAGAVKCGAPMRDVDHPDGWDIGTARVSGVVSCPACTPRVRTVQS